MNPIHEHVISDPGILGGTPVFKGTRVPARTLFDYLEAGSGIDEFLDDFPTVSREQAIDLIKFMRERIITENYESAA